MANFQVILDAFSNTMKAFMDDDPKPPLHIGEAMGCWTYLGFLGEVQNYERIALNTTIDPELKDLFETGLELAKSHIKQLHEFMQNEGVPLPPMAPEKTLSDPNDIPLGVKLSDNELANGMVVNLISAAVMCATVANQSLRADVSLMFLKFQLEKMAYMATFKTMIKTRGWLKVPPSYNPPGRPEP
jgi:hypothetical protein